MEKLRRELKSSVERFAKQQNAAKEKERIYLQTAKKQMAGDSGASRMER